MENDNAEAEYFRSKEFKDACTKTINAATWDRGLPKIISQDGWVVELWKDGRIVKLKKTKNERNIKS